MSDLNTMKYNDLQKLAKSKGLLGSGTKEELIARLSEADGSVSSDDKTEDEHYTEYPVIIIEVLSQSTYQKDRTTKRFAYLNLPRLLEYVLVEQDFVDIEVLRKNDDWKSKHYFLGDNVNVESIDLSVSVEDIYHRVQNQDMLEFLNKKPVE